MTLDATTQHHVRSAVMPLSRRYRIDRMYEVLRLRCMMFIDIIDPRIGTGLVRGRERRGNGSILLSGLAGLCMCCLLMALKQNDGSI